MSTILAIPIWNDRVSTTLDFAGRLLIVEIDAGREISRRELELNAVSVQRKASLIRNAAVQVILCGAVSQAMAFGLAREGIQIVPFVSGQVDDVIAAYLCGRIAEPCYLQPGCRPGARRRWRNRGGFCGRVSHL